MKFDNDITKIKRVTFFETQCTEASFSEFSVRNFQQNKMVIYMSNASLYCRVTWSPYW